MNQPMVSNPRSVGWLLETPMIQRLCRAPPEGETKRILERKSVISRAAGYATASCTYQPTFNPCLVSKTKTLPVCPSRASVPCTSATGAVDGISNLVRSNVVGQNWQTVQMGPRCSRISSRHKRRPQNFELSATRSIIIRERELVSHLLQQSPRLIFGFR